MTSHLPVPRWDEPQPPDPYPERLRRETGVRPHTTLDQRDDWMVEADLDSIGPLLLAAEQTAPMQTGEVRHGRLPWASTGLYALGQVALAVAIALGNLQATTGIAICLLWMICGLTLIAAQTITERNAQQR